jgi:hypothetical protein
LIIIFGKEYFSGYFCGEFGMKKVPEKRAMFFNLFIFKLLRLSSGGPSKKRR